MSKFEQALKRGDVEYVEATLRGDDADEGISWSVHLGPLLAAWVAERQKNDSRGRWRLAERASAVMEAAQLLRSRVVLFKSIDVTMTPEEEREHFAQAILALAERPSELAFAPVATLLEMKQRDVPEGPCWCVLWPDEPQVCEKSPHCLALRAALAEATR